MRKTSLLIAAAAISMLSCFPALAGEWKQDQTGWWYDHGDSTYAQNGWEWVEGRCYYFNQEGYCLLDTTTPDGYTVDGSGAWTVDGVVQVQTADETAQTGEAAQTEETAPVQEAAAPEISQIGSLSVQTPDGFILVDHTDGLYIYGDSAGTKAISVASQSAEELGIFENGSLSSLKDSILDYAMQVNMGDYTSRANVELSSGAWIYYHYASIQNLGVEGSMDAYVRLHGTEMQIVAIAGTLDGMDTAALMNAYVK